MKQSLKAIITMTFFSLCAGLILTTTAQAATLTVTSTGDTTVGAAGCGDGCSLREAITAAVSGDTIVFDSTVFAAAQTINLTSQLPTISKNLIITGTGARLLTVLRSTATNYRIFNITAGTVRISGMTISNGSDSSGGGGGVTTSGTSVVTLDGVTVSGTTSVSVAAVDNLGGTLTILNSTISNNSTIGVAAEGTAVNIANSTISGNNGTNQGVAGGIYNAVTLNLNNVTVANNVNGGIENGGNAINIRNTIITGSTGRADALGGFTSRGNNLVSNLGTATGFSAASGDKLNVVANLAALANNGGQTDTHRPNTGSPAIDAGNNCVVTATCGTNNPPVALTNDQRGTGFGRQGGTSVDIGAIEAVPPTAANASISGRVTTADGRGITNVSITVSGGNLSEPKTVRTSSFGNYSIADLAAGETYIVEIRAKRYSFTNSTRVISLMENVSDQNFIAAQ